MLKFKTGSLTKPDFEALKGQQVKVGRYVVVVCHHERRTQSGTYATGLKFHKTTYGVLKQDKGKFFSKFSADGGETWHHNLEAAFKSKGKIMLNRETTKEFAYDSIQRLNRQYGY